MQDLKLNKNVGDFPSPGACIVHSEIISTGLQGDNLELRSRLIFLCHMLSSVTGSYNLVLVGNQKQ